MPSILEAAKIGRPSPTRLVAGVGVVLLILGLFFTPSFENMDETAAALLDKLKSDVVPEVEQEQFSRSPLEEILFVLEQPRISAETGLNKPSAKLLRKETVRKSLRQAKKKSLAIAAALSDDFPQASEVLETYAKGIDRILGGHGIPADSVPAYISRLDSQVTRALKDQGVPQQAKLEWSEISAGPHVQSKSSLMDKQDLAGPFDPKLRLRKLWIRQGFKHRGKDRSNARVTVKATGYVRGDHVSAVHLYRNGQHLRNLPLSANMNEYGLRKFKFKQRDGVKFGIFTFRVIDVGSCTLIEARC